MSKSEGLPRKIQPGIVAIAIVATLAWLVSRYVGIVGNVAVALIGFGIVVLVHEFGHFIVAKFAGIKVEAFSIGMPPTVLGVQRTERGIRVRVLPMLSSDEDEPAEGGLVSLTLGKTGRASDTEYRIGLIPFGGYVKLLGQEDVGPVKQNSDPRSFANKSIRARMAVIAAGVTFNVISAVVILMTVFLVGIKLSPPVVGAVRAESPAARAGLQSGDEIIAIDGQQEDLDFSSIILAAALSEPGEPVDMTVRHRDGSVEDMTLMAEMPPNAQAQEFGIFSAESLTLAEVRDSDRLKERTGLSPGDRIVAVNGQAIEHRWQLDETVDSLLQPVVELSVERTGPDGNTQTVETELPLSWVASDGRTESDAGLRHVYGMVPRLRLLAVSAEQNQLQVGDILMAVGEVTHPTYRELREVTVAYEGKPLPIAVLRRDPNGLDQRVTVTVTPQRDAESGRVLIGFVPVLDADNAVVAKTITADGMTSQPEIPRGATVTAVNGEPVASYYDIIDHVRRWDGQPVTLQYRNDGDVEGGVTLAVTDEAQACTVVSAMDEVLPFRPLDRLYKASGPLEAIKTGYRQTVRFVAMTYVTLNQLIRRRLSPKMLMGPVGIITMSYQIVAQQPLVNYAYWLGLISATIAVMNFLPLPPFDGGLIVLMLIEKIRGAALSERTQAMVAYAGWGLVLALLLYVTANDIQRSLPGFFS
jgi:regulator of sigma E protease